MNKMIKNSETGFAPILIVVTFLILAILISSGMWFFSPPSQPKISIKDDLYPSFTPQPSPVPSITSVTDALQKSHLGSIKCTRIPKDETTPIGITYLKDGKIRMEGGNPSLHLKSNTTGLFMSNKLWIWDTTSNEGHLLKINPTDSELNIEVFAKGLDEYEQMCEYSEIDPLLFTLPENIEFKEY